MKQAESHILVIFGASGDLTKRKLIPALLELEKQNLLPDQFAVLGVSRTELSDEVFRSRMTEFLPKEASSELIEKFLNRLYYQAISTADAYDYPVLRDRLFTIAKENNIKIIFITAKGREVEIAKGLSLGADVYITKPFSNTELVSKVKELLVTTHETAEE